MCILMLTALRMSVRSSLYDRTNKSSHEHQFGPETYNEADDTYTHACITCNYAETFEKMWEAVDWISPLCHPSGYCERLMWGSVTGDEHQDAVIVWCITKWGICHSAESVDVSSPQWRRYSVIYRWVGLEYRIICIAQCLCFLLMVLVLNPSSVNDEFFKRSINIENWTCYKNKSICCDSDSDKLWQKLKQVP
jgi:hypothetical protein